MQKSSRFILLTVVPKGVNKWEGRVILPGIVKFPFCFYFNLLSMCIYLTDLHPRRSGTASSTVWR